MCIATRLAQSFADYVLIRILRTKSACGRAFESEIYSCRIRKSRNSLDNAIYRHAEYVARARARPRIYYVLLNYSNIVRKRD